MTEQQQFRPGDRVKVTMNLTVTDDFLLGVVHFTKGTVYPSIVQRWADEIDHIDVELIERTGPPREPGWYLCAYGTARRAMHWDGEGWRWSVSNERLLSQNGVTVLGTITLNEGVEL